MKHSKILTKITIKPAIQSSITILWNFTRIKLNKPEPINQMHITGQLIWSLASVHRCQAHNVAAIELWHQI